MNILIVDYGMGNIKSVHKKLYKTHANLKVSSDPKDVLWADKIILVGVGHFKKAMDNLNNLNLIDELNDYVLVKKKPILGICLGMQLMCNSSEEGDVEGLGWIDAEIVRFIASDSMKFKIPHIGWNQIKILKPSYVLKGINEYSEFYFIHSYFAMPVNNKIVLNETDYIQNFCSAFEDENIIGVQYHPEKSHDIGEKFFNNFLNF